MKKITSRRLRAVVLWVASLFVAVQSQAFQILVDLNQLGGTEAAVLQNSSDYRTQNLRADGVWMVTPLNSMSGRQGNGDEFNNATWWINSILNLNGSNWLVSEDLFQTMTWYSGSTPDEASYLTIRNTYGLYPNQAVAYNEPGARGWPANSPSGTVLVYDAQNNVNQLPAAYYTFYSTPVLALARNYGSDQPYLDTDLAYGMCGGGVFEIGIHQTAANTQPYSWANLPAGITNILNAGKKCYIVLSPEIGAGFPVTDYTTAVTNFMGWLNAQFPDGPSSVLHSPNLYIVVAKYGTPGVGFFEGLNGSDYYRNNLMQAVLWLKGFRTFGTY